MTTSQRVDSAACSRPAGVATLVTALFLCSTAVAEACFCAPACAPGLGSAVFDATVIAIGPSTDRELAGAVVVSLADVTVIAGAVPGAVVQTASSCDYVFQVGVRYRIEGVALEPSASGWPARRAWVSQCGATRPLWTWDLRAVPTMVDWWWSSRGCRD